MSKKIFSAQDWMNVPSESEKQVVVPSDDVVATVQEEEDITNLPFNQNGKTTKWIKEYDDLPTFPDSVYADLPSFLVDIVNNAISSEAKDTVLLGALVCFSACFPNVCGAYDDRIVYPNLYLFLVGTSGGGKADLNLCRELVRPIHKKLLEESKQLELEYKRAVAEYNKEKKSVDAVLPTEPPRRMLLIPANSSSSAFLKILNDNDGMGLMFETEGDTLSQTLRSDFGNYSDVLRKAFHHEELSLCRKTGSEQIEIDTPKLSVVLSGTPEQVRYLIPNAENGLMGRFIYYFLPGKRYIRDVLRTTNVSETKQTLFSLLGQRFLDHCEEFRQDNYSFVLPEELQSEFILWLRTLNDECCDEVDEDVQGVIRRLGLIAFRLMMILTCIRRLRKPRSSDLTSGRPITLVCQVADYDTAIGIVNTIVCHSIFCYRKLSKQSANPMISNQEKSAQSRRNSLFKHLPDVFTKKEYSAVVTSVNENSNTAAKWIDKFISERKLERVGQGQYRKI